VRSLQGPGDVGLPDSGNHSTDCNLRATSRLIVKVRGRGHWYPLFYSQEMARWAETFHKVPTLHRQTSNPLISICHSRPSDWVRVRRPWLSIKVTLIEPNPCNSVAQLYRTTNYWLPLILFYTARSIISRWIHSLRTSRGVLSILWSILYLYQRTLDLCILSTFYILLRSLALYYIIRFILLIEILINYKIDISL
jgi:hypothetical protein